VVGGLGISEADDGPGGGSVEKGVSRGDGEVPRECAENEEECEGSRAPVAAGLEDVAARAREVATLGAERLGESGEVVPAAWTARSAAGAVVEEGPEEEKQPGGGEEIDRECGEPVVGHDEVNRGPRLGIRDLRSAEGTAADDEEGPTIARPGLFVRLAVCTSGPESPRRCVGAG
jgi:hypothetical protein